MFTTPCFIRKNTPELRKKLEEFGYTNGAWESPHFEYPYLMCFPNRKFGLFKGEGFYITENDYRCDGKRWTYNPPKEYIDCGTNEELFLALAALRDDKPDYQWFLWEDNDGIYHTELEDSWRKYIPNEKWEEWWWFEVRKATVEEIIEHFKKD